MVFENEKLVAVDRMEGTIGKERGGLIIKKKNDIDEDQYSFKIPAMPTKFGLEKKAEEIRQREASKKNIRSKTEETPSDTGGVSKEYLKRDRERKERDRERRKYYEDDRRPYKRSRDDRSEERSVKYSRRDWNGETPRNRRPETPRLTSDNTPSRSGWDDDDKYRRSSNDSWEVSTPHISSSSSSSSSRRHDRTNTIDRTDRSRRNESERRRSPRSSTRDRYSSQRGYNGRTPRDSKRMDDEDDNDEEERFENIWHASEDGFENLDVVNMERSEYFLRKEGEMEAKKMKLSAIQKEINRNEEKWSMDRMDRGGVIVHLRADYDYDETETSKVHLIIRKCVPPFLDGSVAFTKQSDPVIPIKDPQGHMAKLIDKGSAVVKNRKTLKEREKAVKEDLKPSEMMKNVVLGIKDKEDEEDQTNLSGEGDYKSDKKFADHMKKSGAVSEFAKTKTIKEQREYLPVYAVRQEFLKLVRENSVIIAAGETGSGKTTQLTQYLHEEGYTRSGRIGCTQPRKVAAMSVAARVAVEMGVELGKEVGYAIRFDDRTSKKTVIKYMTDGILLRESLRDSDLDNYSVIIMDEAHERSLNTDVLFGLLREILTRRSDLKLIVTSATLNSEKFSEFFGHAAVFNITGRSFPIEYFHSKGVVEDYVDAAVKQAVQAHIGGANGDILIFMPGEEDIKATCELITEKLSELKESTPMTILPMFSQMPPEQQALIFHKAPEGIRKCVVSTNVAETSLTVDGIQTVIDCGYCKMKIYNPKIGMDMLQLFPISKANAMQRGGRAGRTGPGVCFRMYTARQYHEELLECTVPEIQRTNLCNVVLLLKALGVEDILQFNFMDPPPKANIESSMYQLWMLGALDNTGALTPLGRNMEEFPLDPALSKMLLFSAEMGCSEEILTIVSMLSIQSVFYRPKGREEVSDAAREKFQVPESDHLTYLNVYNQWKDNRRQSSWCAKHFINSKGMRKVEDIRGQLKEIMEKQKIKLVSANGSYDLIRKCICSAYFQQAAKVKGLTEYVILMSGVTCHVHPTSALYGIGVNPDYIVYHELVMTSKEYLHCVTAVSGEWLAELGPMFYSIKETGQTKAERNKSEEDRKRKMDEPMKKAQEIKSAEEEEVKESTKQSNSGVHDKCQKTPRTIRSGIGY